MLSLNTTGVDLNWQVFSVSVGERQTSIPAHLGFLFVGSILPVVGIGGILS